MGLKPGRDMHYGRLVANLVITGACLGLFALEVAGPNSPAPSRRPIDTFTHVDVNVDDLGVHIPEHDVAAGEVEVTLTDARTNAKSPLLVTSQPPALALHTGTQLMTLRDLTTYRLRANTTTGTAALSVVMPRLDATREPAGRVTVNVESAGMNTPHRDARLGAPIAPGMTDALNASIPWTAVDAGAATVVLHNHRSTALECTVNGGTSFALGRGATRIVKVVFVRDDNLVACGTTKLDLVAT